MEAADKEEEDVDLLIAPPNGCINELLDVGQDDNIEGQVSFLPLCEKPSNSSLCDVILRFLMKDNTLCHE